MNIIKKSFDDLPLAVCFFDSRGRLLLINKRMLYVSKALLNKRASTLDELMTALNALPDGVEEVDADMHVYRFPDGSFLKFTENNVTGMFDEKFTEVTAADVTEHVAVSIRIDTENERLEDANRRARCLYDNMPDIVRDEEILTMKMRIHDDIGHTIISARRALQSDQSIDAIHQNAAQWEKSIDLICRANSETRPRDILEHSIKRAAGLGINVNMTGCIPSDAEARQIIALTVAECASNCLKHAGGSELYVSVSANSFSCSVTITNNGRAPAHEITEGGGLSGLRRLTEGAGGVISVMSLPRFALTMSLPLPCKVHNLKNRTGPAC